MWRVRAEVGADVLTVRRLQTVDLRLDDVVSADVEWVAWSRWPYRVLDVRTAHGSQRFWLVWWSGWRDLAALLHDRGLGDLSRFGEVDNPR